MTTRAPDRSTDPSLTDLERLVAPLAAPKLCGEWLRYDGTYEQVREARREDDPSLPQGVWQTEIKRADWPTVEKLCAEALAQRSKDLQLAAWLLEAWVQLDGFAGAARGLELMGLLCATFWEGMYPALGNDPAARLASVQWVNEKLARRLRLVKLTQPAMEGLRAYSLAEWEVALRNPTPAATSAAQPKGGKAVEAVTMEKFQQSVMLTPYEWFTALLQHVLATIDRAGALDELIDAKAGSASPGLLQFRGAASSVAQLVETMLSATRKNVPPAPEPEPAPEPAAPVKEATAGSDGAQLSAGGPGLANQADGGHTNGNGWTTTSGDLLLRSRADAYRLLNDIADYLHRNEPHSPTPYLIWRAVAWGGLRFDELLPELVRNQGELSDIAKLLRNEDAG